MLIEIHLEKLWLLQSPKKKKKKLEVKADVLM